MEVVKKTNKVNVSLLDLVKFILLSSFGAIMFLLPVSYQEAFSTPLGIVIDFLSKQLKVILPYLLIVVVSLGAVISTITYFFKPKKIVENEFLKGLFVTTPLYLGSRILSVFITIVVFLGKGPKIIISEGTGATMVGLATTLVVIAFSLSYILPFLTDCGIMEFVGILTKPVVRFLFTLPGRASIDLIASWLGASNAAVILTKGQYDAGFYSAREAAVIMTNFSIVSIPFCLIIANILGIGNLFPAFYLVICIVGFVLALIMPRIAPLRKIPDEFNPKTGKQVEENVPEGYSIFGWAVEQSCNRANKFTINDLIRGGNSVLFSMLFSLIPVVITWGTLSLIIVEYTPVFQWLSYPLGYYLKVLGVEYAFEVAPATLVGFVDMFIPAILVTGIASVKTKFIIGVLSLIQIIYVTEVGVIIIQSDVPLKLKDLLIIFLERTIISLPIIVLLANLLVK